MLENFKSTWLRGQTKDYPEGCFVRRFLGSLGQQTRLSLSFSLCAFPQGTSSSHSHPGLGTLFRAEVSELPLEFEIVMTLWDAVKEGSKPFPTNKWNWDSPQRPLQDSETGWAPRLAPYRQTGMTTDEVTAKYEMPGANWRWKRGWWGPVSWAAPSARLVIPTCSCLLRLES